MILRSIAKFCFLERRPAGFGGRVIDYVDDSSVPLTTFELNFDNHLRLPKAVKASGCGGGRPELEPWREQ